MARPAKSINVSTGARTKEDIALRTNAEEALKGSSKLVPGAHLSSRQKEIWQYIHDNLSESNILGSLDAYTLDEASICIDRMTAMEELINNDSNLLYDTKFMASRKQYTTEYLRWCNELCLSPQGRAKMALAAANSANEKANPLLAILRDDDE